MSDAILVPTIQDAFGAYLFSLPNIVSLTATDEQGLPAIYQSRGLQDSTADPYISWVMTRYEEKREVGAAPDVADCDMRLSCYSKNPALAQSLAKAIQRQFTFVQLPFSMSGMLMVLGYWIVEIRDSEGQMEYGLFDSTVVVGIEFMLA